MRHALHYVAPHPQVSSVVHGLPVGSDSRSDAHASTSGNWAGYTIASSFIGGNAYTYVNSQWAQPAVPGDSHYTNYQNAPTASFWAGIGNTYILQAGCDSISTATPTYKCWTEDFPLGTVYEGPTLSPGNTMYIAVYYQGNGTTQYFIENVSTGNYSSFVNSSPYVGTNPADFINERLGQYYLPNFGSVSFIQCNGSSATHYVNLASTNGAEIIMENSGGTIESLPSAVNNTNHGFTDTWKHS